MGSNDLMGESFCVPLGHVVGLVVDIVDGAKEYVDQAKDGAAMVAVALLPKRVVWLAHIRVLSEIGIPHIEEGLKESLKESINSWFEGGEFADVCDVCGACDDDETERGELH